jgi:hypothetical protein
MGNKESTIKPFDPIHEFSGDTRTVLEPPSPSNNGQALHTVNYPDHFKFTIHPSVHLILFSDCQDEQGELPEDSDYSSL